MSSKTLHQRKLNRLRKYDYSSSGYYFVTICTKNKEECFGNVVHRKMILNEIGEIVKQQWLWLEKQYKYIELDEWVIMPNHMHGIITIYRNNINPNCRERSRPFPTHTIKNKILPIWNIIGAFKTTSSKLIHQLGHNSFIWQKSFYDHIIRNEISLHEIRQYIRYNPIKWDEDKNNMENIFM